MACLIDRLLSKQIQDTPDKNELLRILIKAAENNHSKTQIISSYFDLQRSDSGILLPVIRQWPSTHFSFHCWLRLNDKYPSNERRQLYSLYSDSIGLECFICKSSVFISISDRREFVYVEVEECKELVDGSWHSLTIVHTAQRRSLFKPVSTCDLVVYLDGQLKKQVQEFKYIPLLNDPINLGSIGAPSQRPSPSTADIKNDSLHLTTAIAKTIQPLKDLFKSNMKITRIQPCNIISIEPNSQDALFGQSTCLHGQIACVWILADTLNEAQVKHLNTDSSMFDLNSARSLLIYHPLACNDQICVDISTPTSQMNGRLNNASCIRLHSFSESLLNLGGCPVLYPLIEKFQENDYNSTVNPIGQIIDLIRCVLSSTCRSILADQMTKHYNIELLGQHLNRLPAIFIDEQLLIAIQQLSNSSPILFDFHLWNKADSSVRLSHLQYITTIINENKKYYRSKFGVQFFLDILKEDFNDDQQLRYSIYEILKYYIQPHIHTEEVTALISSIATLSTISDRITQELLELILESLEHFHHSNIFENFYALFNVNTLSSRTKEVILKIIAAQQIQTTAFGGIISSLTPDELTVPIVREILNIIINSDSSIVVDHLNMMLTICSKASFDVRYIVIQKVNECFIANPIVCRAYVKCPGWQETFAHYFIKSRRQCLSIYQKDSSIDSGRESTNSNLNIPQIFEISSSPDDPTKEKLVRQIDLSPIISRSNSLDVTPEYLRRNSDLFQTQSFDTTPSSIIKPEILISGVTNVEDTSSATIEELCEILILTIVTILCNADEEVRGQMFLAFRYLDREYEYYYPLDELERRISELGVEQTVSVDMDTMMNEIHKRNRQIENEKLQFQCQIVDQWRDRRRSEHHRTLKLAKQRRLHQIHVEREWKDRKKYLFSERGPWWTKDNAKERHWMLSNRENIHRMRCKIIENENFNNHEDASRLRDNLGSNSIDKSNQFLLEESLKNPNLLIQQEIRNDEQEFLSIPNEIQSVLLDEKEKIIINAQCSLITLTSAIDGKLEITNKYIYFFNPIPENDLKYPLSWLRDVHLRRYNLRPSALEFFLINQTNFLMNFDKKQRREIYQKLMSLKSTLSTTTTPQTIFKESKITEKWIKREISNFDYLMMLNTIAGRTYNDLNQYPIFPWVLKDYTSEKLNLDDPNVYRDFSKPIGIQNPKHIEEVRLKYEAFDDPSGLMKKFHYGTHYSNAAGVMHYLIRMEPFTSLHIQLQSGKFDIPDRQFHSFQSAWSNIMTSPNEVKELIPEFFYLPEFLVNSNKFDLGKLQNNNQIVNDIQLPPWAENSPEEFIRLHRCALESDYVSAHLHEWIDLIFGYKQTGQAAIDALNVFMYCSYEKAVDVDAIDDPITREAIEGMIQNFGQVPSQLLTEPHPQRQTKFEGCSLNIFDNLSHIRAFYVEITPENDRLHDPITFISIPKNQARSFMQQGIPDTLITIGINGVVGNNGWQPLNNSFTFERDPTLQNESNRHIIAAPFSPSLQITSRLFAVSHDAKFIFSGGHWDWSLRVYSLFKSKIISSIIYHTDIITCLALDSTGCILVTGSRDTTCVIWNLSSSLLSNGQESNSLLSPIVTLYGHTSEVTCICVSIELDLVVSGSRDGTCNIHTVEHGIYVQTLRPLGDPIINLQLSSQRHLLIHTENDDETTHLFLYSINGNLIRTKKFEHRIVDMILTDEHILLAVNHTHSNQFASRIIIKDLQSSMKTIQTIHLRTEINCIYLTDDFSHLLAGVKDGKLIVLKNL